MAFWRTFAPSNIEKILEREEFTLEELLDEEDFVQECKHCCNQPLLDFLAKDEVIGQMVAYLVKPIPPVEEDDDGLHRRRMSACAEAFLNEVKVLLDGFSQNENHMKALLGYLQTEETDTVRDGFFCRILISIIKNNEFSQWNQAMPADEFVAAVVGRVGSDSFKNDLFLPIMGSDVEEAGLQEVLQYMSTGALMEKLLVAFTQNEDPAAHKNIAEIFHDLCGSKKTCLEFLQQKDRLEPFLQSLSESGTSPATADCIHVLNGLVRSLLAEAEEEDEFAQDEDENQETPEYVLTICGWMPSIAKALATPGAAESVVQLPAGPVAPPLGRLRLNALHFFSLLLRSHKNEPQVQEALLASRVLHECAEILFSHPWHNIAHYAVEEILSHALECPRLREAVVTQADLPGRCVRAFAAVPPPPEEGTVGDRSYHRLGNLGTVIELTTKMKHSGAGIPEFGTLLAGCEGWSALLEGPHAEELRKQELDLGRGATPDMSRFGVHDSSSSDEERDPDNRSDNSSDEDDDPLRQFGAAGGGGATNDMSDTFRANTAFVNDDASAWETQEITDSSDTGWVADFDSAGWPGATDAVTEADQEAWKADFGSGGDEQEWPGVSTGAEGVEDPFQAAVTGGESSPFEAMGEMSLNDADTIDVSEGFTADFGDFPKADDEAAVVEEATADSTTTTAAGAAGEAEEAPGERSPHEEVLEELSGGDDADLQYLSDMKPMIPEEALDDTAAMVPTLAEEAIAEAVSSPLAIEVEGAAEVPEEGLSSSPPTGL